MVGWTVGGGIEAAVWNNWLLRADYRYADFGTFNHTFPLGPTAGGDPMVSTRIATHTMSLGLAYKFGAPIAASADTSMPLKALRAMAPSWSGFYAGLALGGRRTAADWTTASLVGGATPSADNEALLDSIAFRVGGYAGYNYQIDRVVLGVEGGVGDTGDFKQEQGRRSRPGGLLFPGPDMTSVRSNWDANVVGCVGYLVAPDALVYGAGRITFQNVTLNALCSAASFECLFDQNESVTKTLTGWTPWRRRRGDDRGQLAGARRLSLCRFRLDGSHVLPDRANPVADRRDENINADRDLRHRL